MWRSLEAALNEGSMVAYGLQQRTWKHLSVQTASEY